MGLSCLNMASCRRSRQRLVLALKDTEKVGMIHFRNVEKLGV